MRTNKKHVQVTIPPIAKATNQTPAHISAASSLFLLIARPSHSRRASRARRLQLASLNLPATLNRRAKTLPPPPVFARASFLQSPNAARRHTPKARRQRDRVSRISLTRFAAAEVSRTRQSSAQVRIAARSRRSRSFPPTMTAPRSSRRRCAALATHFRKAARTPSVSTRTEISSQNATADCSAARQCLVCCARAFHARKHRERCRAETRPAAVVARRRARQAFWRVVKARAAFRRSRPSRNERAAARERAEARSRFCCRRASTACSRAALAAAWT